MCRSMLQPTSAWGGGGGTGRLQQGGKQKKLEKSGEESQRKGAGTGQNSLTPPYMYLEVWGGGNIASIMEGLGTYPPYVEF